MKNNKEENGDMNPKPVKEYFRSWRFWKPALAVLAGSTLGFLYYYFVGCSSGHCAITGNPFGSTMMGGVLGWFAVSSPCSRGKCDS